MKIALNNIAPANRKKIKLVDLSFFTVALISLMNINGAVAMAFGVEQAASPLLLSFLMILVWNLGSRPIQFPSRLLLLSITVYLFLGIAASISRGDSTYLTRFTIAYGTSIIMAWALIKYIENAVQHGQVRQLLLTVRNLSIAAAITVLCSPFLYKFFIYTPASAQDRFGGFFGNPNEAGVMSCMALALVLAMPFRQKWVQFGFVTISTFAVALPFSKTAWIVMLVIWCIHLFRKANRNLYSLFPLLGMAAALFMVDAQDALEWITHNSLFELSVAQRLRIEELLPTILSGERSENILTGRDFLWQFGFEKIMESPFFGNGLGTFHFLEGGILEQDVWQGVHNVYLMVWGEAGLIPFVMLILTTAYAARNVISSKTHEVILPISVIAFLNLMVNHNILSSRYFIVIVSLVFGLSVSRSKRGRGIYSPSGGSG